ncbi:hypothetical protein B0I35DRAFT_272604 [Stachybotrys elegans]|uniref:Glycosyltransferase family 28 N-terminal domain-containing protein n=1 Tax=Stachybotrys elegans TaxID=80388 RepID=A0A8K0WPK5_9HYPO|nr:hypothetical protein B0I35DRAFT_272604 [Stachybotrys elegans]
MQSPDREPLVLKRLLQDLWSACTESVPFQGEQFLFVADAIIANPAAVAHIHCAEALGIPVHIMSTNPCRPTTSYRHPNTTILRSNIHFRVNNFRSYFLVDSMGKRGGLGQVIDTFREHTLKLPPLHPSGVLAAMDKRRIPTTHLYSARLLPRALD